MSVHIDIITMGCSKNLVDSEKLIARLEARGYTASHNPEVPQGDITVINTCGFIDAAKEESINTILQFAEYKSSSPKRRLFVMGCLSERYRTELLELIPQIDKIYGKFDWGKLIEELPVINAPCSSKREMSAITRHLTTPSHYAYVKISEGCDRTCAYCAIPLMTGKHVSRPMEEIIEEVQQLANSGVREIQLIAQELTYYGLDIYGKRTISALVEQLTKIDGIEWIRLHYAYPDNFPMELLDVMASNSKVCKYLDIALQHVSTDVLSRMRRNTRKEELTSMIEEMRRRVPEIHLRTTLMVGFPGETESDFQELLEFVKTLRFERLGVFTYSHEEGTYSGEHYTDDVPDDIKQRRADQLMLAQQAISQEIAQAKVGKTFRVIIDRQEGDYYIGRTEYDSPEVDGEVLIPINSKNSKADAPELEAGNFYNATITSADEFDLYGDIIR